MTSYSFTSLSYSKVKDRIKGTEEKNRHIDHQDQMAAILLGDQSVYTKSLIDM